MSEEQEMLELKADLIELAYKNVKSKKGDHDGGYDDYNLCEELYDVLKDRCEAVCTLIYDDQLKEFKNTLRALAEVIKDQDYDGALIVIKEALKDE